MEELKDKFIYIGVIVLIVLVILFSNLGQSFKNDIVSPIDVLNHMNTFKSMWTNSTQYSEYINSSSDYITEVFKSFNAQPLFKEGYSEEWESINPNIIYLSNLEILSGANKGKVLTRFKYGQDFYEDFRGLIKSGSIYGKAEYISNLEDADASNYKILLFDGYMNKSPEEIAEIDAELLHRGISSVISPSYTGDLKKDSGIFNAKSSISEEGLKKLIVSQSTFEELKKSLKTDNLIKVKSGGEIRNLKLKNIYGYIEGKNTSYRPLVVVAFYDGLYTHTGYNEADFESYTMAASLLLDTVRSIKFQRAKAPDRSIIFILASGYLNNKEGINKINDKNINGDILVLDGFGKDDANFISYSKNARYLSSSVEYFLNKYDFKVVSKNLFNGSEDSFLYLAPADKDMGNTDISQLNQSGRFLLSFIGEECYNLDFLSGNIAEFRSLKRFVKDYSAMLSLITMIFLTYIVFKGSGKKYH